jgi:myo-inositol 2-dehydrogenase/D-chiro-inositol 1-dehydrogenase
MTHSLGFGIIGAGRIGKLHAKNIVGSIEGAHVVIIMDAFAEAADALAKKYNAVATQDIQALINHPDVDAVVIGSPTSLHAEQIKLAAQAGKAIFCEKPVALDLATTQAAMRVVQDAGVPFQIGFNRRFDPAIASLARTIHSGELGKVEMFRSQSSDPSPPPLSYVATSGGIFLDSAVHDFDIARFIGGEVERVTALGRVLVEPEYAQYHDVDTSVVTLEFSSGALGIIQNSRRTQFGHDVRVEVHAASGKLVAEQERRTTVWNYTKHGMQADYQMDFLERFRDAYVLELQAFVDAVHNGTSPTPTHSDAIESLRVALAATTSLREQRPVALSEIT